MGFSPFSLPSFQPGDPSSGADILMQGAKLRQQRQQDAAQNLLAQQNLQLKRDELAQNAAAQSAQEKRLADAAEEAKKRQSAQDLASILPFLDPTSPDFNPGKAAILAQSVGGSATVQDQGAPPAPGQPQAPFVGPIPSAHDAMMGALSGTRTDNPNHQGQVFLDQSENGSSHLVPPEGGAGAFNFPSGQLGTSPAEGRWIPDPRRGRAYVDQVENGSAHLLGAGGGDAFNAPTSSLPSMPKESQWIRDPRGPADPLPIQTQAAQEAMQQQAERDQYQKQLAEAPQRQAQYAKEQQDFQQRKQFPNVQLDMGDGHPQTVDTLALYRQAEGSRQMRAKAWGEQFADNPGAAKVASSLAALGLPDKDIVAAIKQQYGEAGKDRRADETDATRRYGIDARRRAGGAGGMAPGSKAFKAEESELSSELTKYNQTHGLTGPKSIAEGQRELESALHEAEHNPNGASQLRIMDKMIRSATGIGVRNQTLQTYMGHLGGLAAQGQGKLEGWVTGKIGQEQWRNVVESMRSQLAELQGQGGKENEDFHRAFDSSPAAQRHPDLLKRREAEMFGGMHGFGANPLTDAANHPRNAPAGETKTVGGKTYRKTGPNNWQEVTQ